MFGDWGIIVFLMWAGFIAVVLFFFAALGGLGWLAYWLIWG